VKAPANFRQKLAGRNHSALFNTTVYSKDERTHGRTVTRGAGILKYHVLFSGSRLLSLHQFSSVG